MYTKKIKRGSSEKSTSSNQLITARNLRLKVKQLVDKDENFELEPVQVLKVYPTGSADKGFIDYGRIVGRYTVSEQGLPFNECKDFIPLDNNVLQYPLENEVVIGLEFNGERYYFSSLNINPKKVNFTRKISDNRATQSIDYRDEDLKYFENTSEYKTQVRQGDTLIQGRNNNYVKLSSDDGEKTGNIVLSTNDKQSSKNITDDKSFIRMTTSESVNYSEQVKDYGIEMAKWSWKKPSPYSNHFETTEYNDGQIYIGSDRLTFSAEEDDIAIFAKGKVHIKADKVQIKNAMGGMELGANQIITDAKTKIDVNKKLGENGVILAPEGMQEMGAVLAKQVEWNLDFIKVQIGSLIPAVIPGTRGVVSPAWFKNIRDKIKNAKKLLEFNDLVLKLKWLDKSRLKTYTMDELKEALKPIPGFAAIIGGVASLTQLKAQADTIKATIDGKIDVTKALKTQALTTVSGTIDSIKDAPNQILNQTQVEQLKQNVEDFEQERNDLNTYKGAPALKSRITEYEVAKENLQNSFGDDLEMARQQFQDKEESLRTLIVNGEVNSFSNRIIEIDNEVTTLEGSKTLVDSLADLQTEIEE
jgi:hypothetical protein